MRFHQRIVLITGGAGGIGRATSARFANEGARVAVADIDDQGAREVADSIGGFAVQVDVCLTESVKAAVAAVEQELGQIDVLVNNAGTDEFAFFVDTDEQLWDRIIAVNLRAVINTTHAVLPAMITAGKGRIVNVASEAGRVGSSGEAVYSAAKGGVIAFTKSIAREVARYNILCNAVSPGPVDTQLFNKIEQDLGARGKKIKEAMVRAVPLRRPAQPDEVAATIAFLASEDASYITGQVVGVNGGLVMQ